MQRVLFDSTYDEDCAHTHRLGVPMLVSSDLWFKKMVEYDNQGDKRELTNNKLSKSDSVIN